MSREDTSLTREDISLTKDLAKAKFGCAFFALSLNKYSSNLFIIFYQDTHKQRFHLLCLYKSHQSFYSFLLLKDEFFVLIFFQKILRLFHYPYLHLKKLQYLYRYFLNPFLD